MASSKFTNFVMYIVLLITFLGLINMIFNLHRFAFYGELLILLGLAFLAIISVVGINNNFRWGWILLKIFFIFVVIDMILIYILSTAKIKNILSSIHPHLKLLLIPTTEIIAKKAS